MLSAILLLLGVLFLIWYKNRTILPSNVPPGPWRLPVIGNLIQLALCKRPLPFDTLHEISNKYGPITFLQIGALYQVVLEDLDIIKEVLSDEIWVDRYYNKFLANRSYGKVLGVLLTNGRVWKEMRKFSVRNLRDFGFGKEKNLDVQLQDEIVDFTSRLERKIGQDNIICMKKVLSVSVLNIMWSMLAGSRFSYEDEKLNEMLEIIEDSLKLNPIGSLTSPVYLFAAFPFLENFSFLFSFGHLLKAQKRLRNFFQKILEERRAKGRYMEDQRDFIDVFMCAIDAHKNDDLDTNLYTDEQFVVLTMDLFMASLDATSNTLEFAFYFFTQNSKVQRKIQDEIDKVVGNNRLPRIADRVNMPYTEAAILEVQRHANAIPINIRGVTKETTLRGYTIPAKSVALINLYAMHMSKKTWGDPFNFRPERFLTPDMQIVNDDKILPFGAGTRGCFGKQQGKATLFMYITTMLQKFTFEEAPSHPLPNKDPLVGITLSPKKYHALIKSRAQKPDSENIIIL